MRGGMLVFACEKFERRELAVAVLRFPHFAPAAAAEELLENIPGIWFGARLQDQRFAHRPFLAIRIPVHRAPCLGGVHGTKDYAAARAKSNGGEVAVIAFRSR